MARILDRTGLSARAPSALDVAAVYDEHADFVWRSLHRLGVRSADLPDLVQEAFLVVHRRRGEHDGERSVRGWLWGIAVGLVRNYRRRAFRRLERPADAGPELRAEGDPEAALVARRRRQRGERALATLDPEKRAVFVMFEVEGMSGREIAALLDVPIGTVHSRLFGARRELGRALADGVEVERDPADADDEGGER